MRERTGRVVVALAAADDPVVASFGRDAARYGVDVWRPAALEDVGWRVAVDGASAVVELHDRLTGRRWSSHRLGGLWYQSLPPLRASGDLGARERAYADTEFRAALRAVWHEAACIAIGQPPAHASPGLFDFGLEARVHLRALGLPVLVDHVGEVDRLRARLARRPAGGVRLSSLDRSSSAWLTDDDTAQPPDRDRSVAIVTAATITDGRPARVAVLVDDDVLTVEVGEPPTVLAAGDETIAIEMLARRIGQLTRARVLAIYLGDAGDRWAVARLSLQLPYWLADVAASWLNPRLVRLFAPRASA